MSCQLGFWKSLSPKYPETEVCHHSALTKIDIADWFASGIFITAYLKAIVTFAAGRSISVAGTGTFFNDFTLFPETFRDQAFAVIAVFTGDSMVTGLLQGSVLRQAERKLGFDPLT